MSDQKDGDEGATPEDGVLGYEWSYPAETRSAWLPAGGQEMVDSHPWTRRAIEKNPRFPGFVPAEALFCWSETDFAGYVNSGGFVKPKLKCQYFLSPQSPPSLVDVVVPLLERMNWACSVDTNVGRDDAVSKVTDYMGMPMAYHRRVNDDDDDDDSEPELEYVRPGSHLAPIFIWEGWRNMINHEPTLKYRGLVNRIAGIDMFTKCGMLELVRERCIEREIPLNFPPPWFPLTFELPDDLEQWKRHAAANPHMKWMYKPNGETMGRGIILVSRIEDVDTRERPFRTRCRNVEVFDPNEAPLQERHFAKRGIIQEYMVNPMLLDNRKFAVRVYLLVARVAPMLAFHYNFGYVKRCGEYYDENKFNREDLFRHITNQEFQKKQDDFGDTKAADLLSIEALGEHLEENMGIPAFRLRFWEQVKVICTEVCLGMKAQVQRHGRFGMFEVFGLDVIVDADQQVIMLEANRDPSWVMDTEVKQAVIPDMLREMLGLVFWAHSDAGAGQEALLSSPMSGFELLIDEAFDFQAVDVD